jgi:hypothetical protein
MVILHYGWELHSWKMSHSPKHFDEITSLFSAKCPFGKTSVRQNVRSAKRPFGKMSVGKMSVRQNVFRQNVRVPISVCGGGERCTLSSLSPGQTRKHCSGNICDSRCFLKCFPVCPPVETLLRKQNLLPEKKKCFLANSETLDVSLCFSLMFPIVRLCPLLETWRNIGRKQCFRNNVS